MFILDFAEKFKWVQQRVQDSETELKENRKIWDFKTHNNCFGDWIKIFRDS